MTQVSSVEHRLYNVTSCYLISDAYAIHYTPFVIHELNAFHQRIVSRHSIAYRTCCVTLHAHAAIYHRIF